MNPIVIPPEYNYIGVFLTLSCPLKCSYCINLQNYSRSGMHAIRKPMSTQDWITALNRIEATTELPLSLQGGEPTSHPGFYEIINGVNRPMDLLTNCQFNIQQFLDRVPQQKFARNAPYASIRVSYHPEQMELLDLVDRVSTLFMHGYQVGVWSVDIPEYKKQLDTAAFMFGQLGISFRTKELLGKYKGHIYGTYKYKNAVDVPEKEWKKCLCRTSELLIAPDGSIHRCHSDLYNLRPGIGHVLEEQFTLDRMYRECSVYGNCSGCDVKIKTNRFQEYGHTSVEIKEIT